MSVFAENQSDAEATAVLRHAAIPCVNSPQTAHNAAYGNFAPQRTPGEGDRSEFIGKNAYPNWVTDEPAGLGRIAAHAGNFKR